MSKSNKIIIRIIAVFSIAILMSFMADQFHDFFGDWQCQGGGYVRDSSGMMDFKGCQLGGSHNPTIHWGYRHWLLFIMGLFIFITQAVVIIEDSCD